MSYLLLNMKTHVVVSKHGTRDEADNAQEAAEFPAHVVKENDWGDDLAMRDMVAFYNNLPTVSKKVTRFTDRATAKRRLAEAMKDEPVEEVSNTDVWEGVPMTKKKRVKTATTTTRGPEKVALAAAGRKDNLRFQKDSPRSKVFAAIKAAGEIEVDKLVKKFDSLTRGQVLGCIQKLKALDYIKVS
jgi:hypothetical protein